MGITEPSQNMNAFILAGITVVFCVIMHFIYNTFVGNKRSEVQNHEAENVTGRRKNISYTLFIELLVLHIKKNAFNM